MLETCVVYGFLALIFLLMVVPLFMWGRQHQKTEESLQRLADKRGISREEALALVYKSMNVEAVGHLFDGQIVVGAPRKWRKGAENA